MAGKKTESTSRGAGNQALPVEMSPLQQRRAQYEQRIRRETYEDLPGYHDWYDWIHTCAVIEVRILFSTKERDEAHLTWPGP